MKAQDILDNLRSISAAWADQRPDRQKRTALDPADFQQLRDAGFLLTGVPAEMGGAWQSVQQSTRPIAETLRVLAGGDPAVALVSSMHPAVLSFWLAIPTVDGEHDAAWQAQRRQVAETAAGGAWWGTITSEPGSGGDVARSRAAAIPTADDGYTISGQKHFGSGSGITSYMVTTALPVGADEPDWFFIDVRDAKWDGSSGMKLVAPWDGHGMAATQSHGFAFENYPATRVAWPGHLRDFSAACGAFIGCCFTAVVLGIVQTAMATARGQLEGKRDTLRAYERVHWSEASNEAWLMEQAYEGMLRAVEAQDSAALLDVLRGKEACATLAESVLNRLCKVIGGGTFGRSSPFGYWFEDVRALGFLRPPWGLAFDQLFDLSWQPPAEAVPP